MQRPPLLAVPPVMDAMSSHQIFSLTASAGEVVGRVCVGECDEDTEKLSLFATAGLRTRHLAVPYPAVYAYRKCVFTTNWTFAARDGRTHWELAWSWPQAIAGASGAYWWMWHHLYHS